jgi:preprotein translocase subunit SecE
MLIWMAVLGAVFAFLWWQGQVQRLANYVRLTNEELRKCTWPTWEELKGHTVVVTITVALLGIFTVVADRILLKVFFTL